MREKLSDAQAKLAKARAAAAPLVREYKALAKRQEELAAGNDLEEGELNRLDELEATIAAMNIPALEKRVAQLETIVGAEVESVDLGEDDNGTDRGGGTGTTRAHRLFPEAVRKLEKGAMVASSIRFLVRAGGNVMNAAMMAERDEHFGTRHPTTRALMISSATGGGLIVPPDYVAEIIEIQRALTVVRASNPRVIPMPRGTMQMPRQSQTATAGYGGEISAIPVSEQAFGSLNASYKKLVAMVPISRDLVRYSDPNVDAIARDDLVQVLARREDLAFLRGDGTADSPRGFASFVLSSQTISSTSAFTLSTVGRELGGAMTKLETANVNIQRPVWIMHPRSKGYLMSVQNANGFYVFKEEMTTSQTILGIPFRTTTQIPINLVNGGDSDCSEVYLVEMSEAMLFDAMALELSISMEGMYVDSAGATVSVFQSDQMLLRAIAEHDFLMRHDNAIIKIQHVRWAPAIS